MPKVSTFRRILLNMELGIDNRARKAIVSVAEVSLIYFLRMNTLSSVVSSQYTDCSKNPAFMCSHEM